MGMDNRSGDRIEALKVFAAIVLILVVMGGVLVFFLMSS
jgi:hypothetical protein